MSADPSIADRIVSSPALASALVAVLTALVGLSKLAGPRTATALERTRGRVWRLLDPAASRLGRPLVRDKTNHREYTLTVDIPLLELLRALAQDGWAYNAVSTKKFRTPTGQPTQWSVATWVYRPSLRSKWQYHVYVFENPDGTLDVHMHKEVNLLYSPRGHVSGPQHAGDVDRVLRDALEQADVGYERRPFSPPA